MNISRRQFGQLVGLAALAGMAPKIVGCSSGPVYKLGWSIYVGWMPWPYLDQSGILDKWAKMAGIRIELSFGDYLATIGNINSRQLDALVVTNMDAMSGPVQANVPVTSIITGDFSNGNDAILTRGIPSVEGLRGKKVLLAQGSVSEYMLGRALAEVGMTLNDVEIVNADEKALVAGSSDPAVEAMVTWKPIVGGVLDNKNAGWSDIYNSAKIPGEIQDLCVVRDEVLKRVPKLGYALAGAWYEVMELMTGGGDTERSAKEAMAHRAGNTLEQYEDQLRTTRMFWTPNQAIAFTASPDHQRITRSVRDFVFDRGWLGSAKSADDFGIRMANEQVVGNPDDVRLTFDLRYMEAARDSDALATKLRS